jgi:DNA-binding response OmpR family regulator
VNSSQSQPKKVLVVDDEKSILELLVLVLQDAGYEVIAASDGREAIVRALQERPDVIILDILMPGLDGWETCDHLMSHEQTAGIPIIFLTARARPEDQLRGWYSGCFDYITKPFEVDQLLKRVEIATRASHEEIERARGELREQRVAVLESEESDDDHSTAKILGWSPSP